MGADSDACPVGTGHGIRPWIAVFKQSRNELVHQVRMRAAVAAALNERQVLRVMDFRRQREPFESLPAASARSPALRSFQESPGSGFFAV